METGVLSWEYYQTWSERARSEAAQYEVNLLPSLMETILDPGAHQKALDNAADLEAERNRAVPICGQALQREGGGAGVLFHLYRYEIALERGLYRALVTLRAVQANQVEAAA